MSTLSAHAQNTSPLLLRDLLPTDCPTISTAFATQGWNKPITLYENYWRELQAGQRNVLLAEWDGEFAGYVTIVWVSDYPPFREAHIPEIVDFNVLEKYQRRGIGTALLDEAERRIAERGDTVGIGVGLMTDYGKAQILYVKRGYIPDGRGLFGQGKWLKYGDRATVDDDLTLYFTKPLPQTGTGRAYPAQTALFRHTLATPDHALDTLLAQMRQTGQSALYLTGTRLDHAYGFVSGDVGILLSVLPEDAEKAAVPGYHPGSAETYFPFQGNLIVEYLEAGQVTEKEIRQYDHHTFAPGQCHRVRPADPPHAASLIVKTNLRHQPGVVRCEQCRYYAEISTCSLHKRWVHPVI
ncbi:MAG TPA: GNAT family N-acetyltransferase [Anaerolineales bacterium]|nr:GNAT family N-acetyltransferase [Anaerolineales bacterium]